MPDLLHLRRPARYAIAALTRIASIVILSCVLLPAASHAAVRPVSIESLRSVLPLAPFMEYVVDPTGVLTLDEVFSPSHQNGFTPLDAGFPLRSSGGTWLRMTIAPRPADMPAAQLLLDLGDDLPGTAHIYVPKRPGPAETVEWQEQATEGRNVFTLPDPLGYPIPIYIKLEGVPGPWFAPQLRTPHNAATAMDRLARPAIVVALGVVMLLCLLRGITERGEWRIWTSLFTAAALTQAVFGPPATPRGVIDPLALPGVLAPGIALMLLPHVARHMLRTRETAPRLDSQYMFLSLPGAALALAPLLPGMAWTARLLPLWPLFMFLLVPTSLAAVVRRLPGARRFLAGCLAPLAGTSLSMLAIGSPAPAALIASGPMWGLACGALLIAGAGTPRTRNETDERSGLPGRDARTRRNPAASRPDLLDPLAGEPGLRLITPEEQRSNDLADMAPTTADSPLSLDAFAPMDTADLSFPDTDGRLVPGQQGTSGRDHAGHAEAGRATPEGPRNVDPALLARMEDALRQPMDSLQQALTGLSDCSLPPLARSQAESALDAARNLGVLTGDLRKASHGPKAIVSRRAVFDLQRSLRDAHDAVEERAEAKNLALSWFMAPHLAQVYEGDAQRVNETLRLLVESAVGATDKGSIHLSVRRVPDSTDPGHLLFTVTDTGAGGPPERRSTIALTRAWELVAASNGTLNVDSGPQGTAVSFSVHLTALSGDLTAPRPAVVEDMDAPAAPAPRPRPLRVLIADDVPSSRQLLTFYLEGLPHETLEARSADECVGLYRRAPAGLVVFDGDMPEDDIATAVSDIRAFEGELGLAPVPLLVLVSHDEQGRRLLQTGCSEALAKPITRTSLRETVLRLAPLPVQGVAATGADVASTEAEGSDAPSPAENRAQADTPHEMASLPPDLPTLSLDGTPERAGSLATGGMTASGTGLAPSPTDASPLTLASASGMDPMHEGHPSTVAHVDDGPLHMEGAPAPAPDIFATLDSTDFTSPAAPDSHQAQPSGMAEERGEVDGESWYPWDRPAQAPKPRPADEQKPQGTAKLPDLFGEATPAGSSQADDLPLLDLIITDPEQDAEDDVPATPSKKAERLAPLPEEPGTAFSGEQPAPASPPVADTGHEHAAAASPHAAPHRHDEPQAHQRPEDDGLAAHDSPASDETEVAEADDSGRPGYDLSALARASANLSAAVRASAIAEEAARTVTHTGKPASADAHASDDRATASDSDAGQSKPLLSAHGELLDASLAPLVPGLVTTLEAALEDALIGRDQDDTLAVEEASCRIAGKAETFGLRVLERIARCVERAAAADDIEAVRDLLPELQAAVERNTLALRAAPHATKGTDR